MPVQTGSSLICSPLNYPSERYFLIKWLDSSEPDLYDTVPARDVTPPEGIDVLDLKPGDYCQACYDHRHYRVKIMASGKDIKCVCL